MGWSGSSAQKSRGLRAALLRRGRGARGCSSGSLLRLSGVLVWRNCCRAVILVHILFGILLVSLPDKNVAQFPIALFLLSLMQILNSPDRLREEIQKVSVLGQIPHPYLRARNVVTLALTCGALGYSVVGVGWLGDQTAADLGARFLSLLSWVFLSTAATDVWILRMSRRRDKIAEDRTVARQYFLLFLSFVSLVPGMAVMYLTTDWLLSAGLAALSIALWLLVVSPDTAFGHRPHRAGHV
jgi:hypothetical protein